MLHIFYSPGNNLIHNWDCRQRRGAGCYGRHDWPLLQRELHELPDVRTAALWVLVNLTDG